MGIQFDLDKLLPQKYNKISNEIKDNVINSNTSLYGTTTRELKQKFNTYKQRENDSMFANENLMKARKEYIETIGKQKNNKGLYSTYRNSVSEHAIGKVLDDICSNTFEPLMDEINYLHMQYEQNNTQLQNNGSMHNFYKNNKVSTTKELENIKRKINVNNRLSFFYNQNKSSYKTIVKYLKRIYWVLFSFVVIVFLYSSKQRNKKFILFLSILLVLPFVIDKIYDLIYKYSNHTKLDSNVALIFASSFLIMIGLNYLSNELLENITIPITINDVTKTVIEKTKNLKEKSVDNIKSIGDKLEKESKNAKKNVSSIKVNTSTETQTN